MNIYASWEKTLLFFLSSRVILFVSVRVARPGSENIQMRGRNSEATPYFSGPGYILSRDLIVDAGGRNVSTFRRDCYIYIYTYMY